MKLYEKEWRILWCLTKKNKRIIDPTNEKYESKLQVMIRFGLSADK